MALELDYMEYANDAAAQAAYPSSDTAIDSLTKLLLHLNGTDGDTATSDASASNHTITFNGTAQLDDAQKEFGTTSLLLDGNSDYLSISDHADWNFGSGNFTIDFWLRLANINKAQTLIAQSKTSGYAPIRIELGGDNKIVIYGSATGSSWALAKGCATALAADTWYHVALVRYGNLFTLYLNGTDDGNDTQAITLYDGIEDLLIGRLAHTTAQYVDGWFDEIRISKGIARWTANFALPVREYTQPLQCYSESTIKQQGSYSLEGEAYKTSSLNDTLTRTIGSPIDLSGKTSLKFDIYASRTGANIKIGIHDSGGTTTEKTHTISTANTWETDTWDISGVSDANKDAIDSIIITITNADADNTFYIDNFFGLVFYTLAIGASSYTVTGQVVSPLYNRLASIGAGSYALSGQVVSTLYSRVFPVDTGSYVLDGKSLDAFYNRLLSIGAGSYTLSGKIANLLKNSLIDIGAGNYTLTGKDIAVLYNRLISADVGSYTLTGQIVALIELLALLLSSKITDSLARESAVKDSLSLTSGITDSLSLVSSRE